MFDVRSFANQLGRGPDEAGAEIRNVAIFSAVVTQSC